MAVKSINRIVEEQPFSDYLDWWPMGSSFLGFMSDAMVTLWTQLPHNSGELTPVEQYVSEYLTIVYDRKIRQSLVTDFVDKDFSSPIQSGEFDALSYAFHRSAFELMEQHIDEYEHSLIKERRLFTKYAGKIFFEKTRRHLKLDLPEGLNDELSFSKLKKCLQVLGEFLRGQGYLRDHFGFRFDIDVEHAGERIKQKESDFTHNLDGRGLAYGIYEMGYPVVLPSAVYLYHTIGEAQHHSSRTIEELFESIGFEARETDDFDPAGHPSNRVVELWEMRKPSKP